MNPPLETVTIEVNPVLSRIIGEIPEVHFYSLRESLSYEDKGAFFKQRSNRFIPDRKYLITEKRREFRTGLFHRVMDLCGTFNIPFRVDDRRVEGIPDELTTLAVDDSYFRDYQLDAIDVAIREKTGMIRIATGGGKTSVICGVAGKLERRCVILVHRLDLLTQVQETLQRLMLYPESVGRVGGGVYEPATITVATVQTICAALGINYERGEDDDDEKPRGATAHREEIAKMLSFAQVVLVDEAHHAPARTVSEVLRRCDRATWRIGFTATDWRDDGADLLLEAAIGPRIFDMSLSDLIELGWLVPAHVFMYPQRTLPGFCDSDHWQTLYKYYYVDNEPFHKQVLNINEQWHEQGRHILTLVTMIKHGMKLQNLHRAAGIPSIFLSGSATESQRREVLNDVRAGRLRLLIGTSIADEGLDLPILDALNLAGGGRSTTRAYQRIGRTLRPFKGKSESLVLDYRCPDVKLNKHSGRRARIYRGERAFTFIEEKK